MQTVSTAWNENQAQRVIRAPTTLEVSILVTDPAAMAAAASSANGEEMFSDSASLVSREEKNPVRYATLEHNFWLLDGSFDILPGAAPYGENGYIGDTLCGDDCSFSEPPTITISFGKVFETLLEGLTVSWGAAYDGEYATEFKITASANGSVVKEETVTGNREKISTVFTELTGYDTIALSVLKWSHPRRRARIERIVVGIEHSYSKSDLSSYSHRMSASLLSAELPETEVDFGIDNTDLLYDPDNDSGMSRYLMTRQEVTVTYGYRLGGKVEKIPAAVTFLDEWETPRNGILANFTARGLQVFMEEKFTGAATGTLLNVAQLALEQANIPLMNDGSTRWRLDASLGEINVPIGVDLSDRTLAEVVQLCAYAGCCVMWQDRNGVLRVEPFEPKEEAEYAISRAVEFGFPETTLSKQLKTVNINDGAYILTVSSSGVEQTVDDPLISVERAPTVAAWVRDILLNRQSLSGEWRADPKVDVLDTVAVDTPFRTNRTVLTSVELTFNGAWRGAYEGTVIT